MFSGPCWSLMSRLSIATRKSMNSCFPSNLQHKNIARKPSTSDTVSRVTRRFYASFYASLRPYTGSQSGVFYDSFTIQNGCRSGNNHHVFFVSKTISTSGNNRVKLSVMVTKIFLASRRHWSRSLPLHASITRTHTDGRCGQETLLARALRATLQDSANK